jgi:mRNA interferase MazF
LKRGEIWTVAGGADYARKPRPAVIVQDDRFVDTKSVTICPFTTNLTVAPLFRLVIEPDAENGLRVVSRLMADKLMTVPKSKLRTQIGCLADKDVLRLNRAMLVFLGIAALARK